MKISVDLTRPAKPAIPGTCETAAHENSTPDLAAAQRTNALARITNLHFNTA
jgi:hypothetical protein